MFCVIDIELFQPLFVLGPKLKWCGTVSFPLGPLLKQLCLFATICRTFDLELKNFLRLQNTSMDKKNSTSGLPIPSN